MADYASNPQLLLAQLFGYVKGAFTGADQTTPGLVAQAENGVLFLDEIHRLPPEGQEMLFLLMDRGIYRMLGDGAVQRKATVRLIAATSEDAGSMLLNTLLRRFAVHIALDELNSRPFEERLALIDLFLKEEATRIGIPIWVSPLVLVALLTFRTSGNVGELQSAVLLGCAKAFLNYMAADDQPRSMPLVLTHLSPKIQLEYLRNHLETKKAEQLVGVEERIYLPAVDKSAKESGKKDNPAGLYKELNRRISGYLGSALEPNEVKKLIQIDAEYYLRRLNRRVNGKDSIPPHFLHVIAGFLEEAGKELDCSFEPEVTTGLALHLVSLGRTEQLGLDETLTLVTHCASENAVVRRLSIRLETELNIRLTAGDIGSIALFLAAHRRKSVPELVKVMVIAHGERTASSMAEVANSLLMENRVTAIDMPLSQSLDDTLQLAAQRIREMGKIKGVLLLVDMGSLTGFGAALERMAGVPVEVIPFVTTAAVVQASQVSGNAAPDLPQMVEAVKQVYRFDTVFPLKDEHKKIIITTCLTGEGTARKLVSFINEALPAETRNNVLVQAVDLENGSEITGLLVEGWRGSVIAAVGTVDPHLPNVEFIGLEQILFGAGMQTLTELAERGRFGQEEELPDIAKDEAIAMACRFIADHIETEGAKFAKAATDSLSLLESMLGSSMQTGQAVRWVIHLAFALERIGSDGPVMEYADLDELEKSHHSLLNTIEQAVAPGSQSLSVKLPRSEIGYLALIVLPE